MSDKRIIIDTLKKIFSIYNVAIEIKEDDLDVKEQNESNKGKDKFKLSKDSKIDLTLQVRATCGFKIYNLNTNVPKNVPAEVLAANIKEINYICNHCLNVLKPLLNAYFLETLSEIEIYGSIEETIETSIIAIAAGKKHPQYIVEPLVGAISRMLHALYKWSNRTYEGRKIPFSFLVCLDKVKEDNFDKICDFLKDDASALLTDGITSYVEVSDKILYKVAPYFEAEQISNGMPLVPYRFSSFGNICTGSNLGVILTVQGDILFIRRKKLIFAKRNGDWQCYDYDTFTGALFTDIPAMHSDVNRIRLIYLTCLDVAFARTGGCLAICDKKEVTNVKKCINPNDIHRKFNKATRKDYNNKRYILEDIVIHEATFYSICRKARQELLGVDGATVIIADGNVITTGAIMDNKFKTDIEDLHGGARTKIAMKLSEFGVAIKISADGYIECYKTHNHIY